MEGGGGDSPNGEVINPVWHGGVEGFYYNREVELNDVVCALCGDGGELLCCEGPCLRSYHATRTTGLPSGCRSLGFTTAQVQAMRHFLCWSCTNRQHRCSVCGARGYSSEPNAQVFRCDHDTCGRFYHPVCISTQLHPGILQRLPDAESGLRPGVHSGAGGHIVRALLFSTIEDLVARSRIAVEIFKL